MRDSGLSTVLALGTGFAASCGMAQADPGGPGYPQVRYEVSGTGVATAISWQSEKGQQHASNVQLP